jgi:hypothetical protein
MTEPVFLTAFRLSSVNTDRLEFYVQANIGGSHKAQKVFLGRNKDAWSRVMDDLAHGSVIYVTSLQDIETPGWQRALGRTVSNDNVTVEAEKDVKKENARWSDRLSRLGTALTRKPTITAKDNRPAVPEKDSDTKVENSVADSTIPDQTQTVTGQS